MGNVNDLCQTSTNRSVQLASPWLVLAPGNRRDCPVTMPTLRISLTWAASCEKNNIG